MAELIQHRIDAVAVREGKKDWVLTGVVSKDSPCGCKVIGGGVLPSPLRVKHCRKHG